jgi:hypothetical protein
MVATSCAASVPGLGEGAISRSSWCSIVSLGMPSLQEDRIVAPSEGQARSVDLAAVSRKIPAMVGRPEDQALEWPLLQCCEGLAAASSDLRSGAGGRYSERPVALR